MATASPSSSRPSNEKERALNQTAPVQQEEPRYRSNLEEFERDTSTRPPWVLTFTEVKLLGIAGVSVDPILVVCTEIDCVPGSRSAFSSTVSRPVLYRNDRLADIVKAYDLFIINVSIYVAFAVNFVPYR